MQRNGYIDQFLCQEPMGAKELGIRLMARIHEGRQGLLA